MQIWCVCCLFLLAWHLTMCRWMLTQMHGQTLFASRLQSSYLHVKANCCCLHNKTFLSTMNVGFKLHATAFLHVLPSSSSLTSYSLCVLHLVFNTGVPTDEPLSSKTKVFMTHNRESGTYFRLEKRKTATRIQVVIFLIQLEWFNDLLHLLSFLS